jgi:hypothetical protein
MKATTCQTVVFKGYIFKFRVQHVLFWYNNFVYIGTLREGPQPKPKLSQ